MTWLERWRTDTIRSTVASSLVVLAGAGCAGASTTDSIQNLTPIEGSSYVTIPPATTTTTTTTVPVPTTAPSPGAVAAGEQVYVVQPNDGPAKIAALFGITMDELITHNAYPEGSNHVFYPGEEVRIPPNALVPDLSAATGTPAPGECPTTYVITAEDTSRIAVAERFGLTFEQMDAANTATPGYDSFVVGTPITIPCP
jgi:LysM repeat protein